MQVNNDEGSVSETQERLARQLELALAGAKVALWSFEPHTGRVTAAQRWEILGYSSMPATYEEWKAFVHPDDLERRLRLMDEYLSGLSPAYEAEFRFLSASGDWVWVRSRGQIMRRGPGGEPHEYAGVVMDISAQVAAREVVHDQMRFIEAMIDGFDTGVIVSSDTQVVYANASFRGMLGLETQTSAELSRLSPEEFFEPEDWQRECRRRRSLALGIAVPSAVYRLRARKGPPVEVALNLSLVMWQGKQHYISIVTALTEHAMIQMHLEATHKRFERVLISELQAQQAHIARELHDSLGSELAGLAMIFDGLKGGETPAQVESRLQWARTQVQRSVEVTRSLARGLMPVGGHAGALWQALERLAQDMGRSKNVDCVFTTHGEIDTISTETGSHLFRIAQEAVSNAVRHGAATRVQLQLENQYGHLALIVRDNGSGFDAARLPENHKGIGLRSMHARAKAIGATIAFRRPSEGGSELKVQLLALPHSPA